MPFKVCKTSGEPRYDWLPVAKITHYPLEKRDYKPFAQCRICLNEDSLFVQMWAFEVSPSQQSCLQCVLYIFKDNPLLALSAQVAPGLSPNWGICLMANGVEQPLQNSLVTKKNIKVSPLNGEDLQGVYWGYTLKIKLDFIREIGGETTLNTGDKFKGNFYKTCTDPACEHYGYFYPEENGLDEFEVVGY